MRIPARIANMSKIHTHLMAALCIAALNSAAQAEASTSDGFYMQYGVSRDKADAYTVGFVTPMKWTRTFLDTKATGYWDFYGMFSVAPNNQGSSYKTWMAGVTPTLRLRLQEGRSNWFVEGGIGVSYSDVPYRTNSKKFSTRFNFADHVGVGYSFGPQRNQEVVLRVQHFSNGGIENPNPGENFLQLRYVHTF